MKNVTRFNRPGYTFRDNTPDAVRRNVVLVHLLGEFANHYEAGRLIIAPTADSQAVAQISELLGAALQEFEEVAGGGQEPDEEIR